MSGDGQDPGPSGTVLVTGAAGFIGSRLVEVLAGRGASVIAVDCLRDRPGPASEKEERLSRLEAEPAVEAHRLDVLDPAIGGLLDRADSVVNLAAEVGLDPEVGESEYERSNVEAAGTLARLSAEAGVDRLLHASTSSVYGAVAEGGEDSPLRPISPYGRTKLEGERAVGRVSSETGLPVVVLRYFSVYGPGQRSDMGYRRLIEAVLAGREFEVFGDAARTRSSTYVDDVVDATLGALTAPADAVVGQTFNVAGGDSVSLDEAIGIVEGLTGLRARLRRLPPRQGDQERTAGDWSRANRAFGFSPKVPFREGIARQVEWQRSLSGGGVAAAADRDDD